MAEKINIVYKVNTEEDFKEIKKAVEKLTSYYIFYGIGTAVAFFVIPVIPKIRVNIVPEKYSKIEEIVLSSTDNKEDMPLVFQSTPNFLYVKIGEHGFKIDYKYPEDKKE